MTQEEFPDLLKLPVGKYDLSHKWWQVNKWGKRQGWITVEDCEVYPGDKSYFWMGAEDHHNPLVHGTGGLLCN